MISENFIKVNKTARYYSIGKLNKNVKKLWFVFHGYGQLAKEFIINFQLIANEATVVIAPEAFNKFYIKGFTGKMGATWMTKEDRENEIIDYVNFINSICKDVSKKINPSNVEIKVLGFSQGGHTAVRWLNKSNLKVKYLFLWGSGFPRDIDYNQNLDYWNNTSLKLIIGNSDKFISKNHINEEIGFLKSQKIKYELINYKGDHSINEFVLSKINKLI